jgi:hypothetical protein
MVADIVSSWRPEALRSFVDRERLSWIVGESSGGIVRPPPHVVRLAFARRVDALPDTVPPVTRAVLGYWVVRDLDPAAAAAFPKWSRDDARHEEVFARYREWFARNREALARLAAPQEPRVAAARRAMDAVTTCRGSR